MNLPTTFKQTCDEPYLRHDYKLVNVHGDSVIFDNYEDVQRTWWNTPSGYLSHVEVLDHKESKKKQKSKGFA